MNLYQDIMKIVAKVPAGTFSTLPVHRWDHVSINTVQSAEVTAHGVVFDPVSLRAAAYWTFKDLKDPTIVTTVMGSLDAKGGAAVSLVAGNMGDAIPTAEANPRIAGRSLFTWQGIKLSVELIFDEAGKRQVYRFDGAVWP